MALSHWSMHVLVTKFDLHSGAEISCTGRGVAALTGCLRNHEEAGLLAILGAGGGETCKFFGNIT